MSHYGFDGEENEENTAFGTECPLPTYEQACANTNEIGFKRDVQFTPLARASESSTRDERINLRDGSEELDDVPVKRKCVKRCYVAIAVLTIIIFLLIVINVSIGKSSSYTYPVFQTTGDEKKMNNNINELFELCVEEKEKLQQKFTSCVSDAEIKELKDYRRTSEKKISDLNNIIANLRMKSSQLFFENELLKDNILPAPNYDDDQTTKSVSTTPALTTTIKNFEHFIQRIESGNLGIGTFQKLIDMMNGDLKKGSVTYSTEKSV